MKRSARIGALASFEQHASDQAARALAEGQRLLRERETVLGELRRYRDDYAADRRRATPQSIVAFQDYQRFLGRLDEAIACQQQLVAESQSQCEAQRSAWLAARGRAVSLEKAVERCVTVEQRSEARREQRRLDETANRAPSPAYTRGEPPA